MYEWRPDWKTNRVLRFIYSSPPGLTRARNAGIEAGDADLVIFVDDDVVLESGFISEHVKAANRNPRAIGVVGRIRARSDGYCTTTRRAVGQIRVSGYVEPNFDSVEASATLVSHTAMGANMSYRRKPLTAIYGNAWFDERMFSSAFREETVLGAELFRAGEHLVYAPKALLTHFESVVGGCANRGRRTLRKLIDHFSSDYLFLNRLYEPVGLARLVLPWLLLRRDLNWAQDRHTAVKKLIVNIGGYLKGRALFNRHRPDRQATPLEPAAEHAVRRLTSA
jgi:GT2 family glycosyltransferase